jgi:hypothetical protein
LKTKLLLFVLLPLALIPIMGVAAQLTSDAVAQEQTVTSTPGQYDTLGLAIGAGLAIGLSGLGWLKRWQFTV